MKTLQEDGGSAIADAAYYLFTETLFSSSTRQEEVLSSNTIVFEELWSRLMASPELRNNDTLDDVTELISTHAWNIKIPNFARWMTIFPALVLFLDNWTHIYFIAVALEQSTPSTSSLS